MEISFKGGKIMKRYIARGFTSSYMTIIISSLLLIGLFFITWYQFSRQTRVIINQIIAEDVAQLKVIFDEIHRECGILGFDHEKNYIDFLTVKEFVSNEIGAMSLILPEKWRGPYVQDNLAIQSKVYEIAKTKDGYYIIPGSGVSLSNGKIMGKDIIITPTTDVHQFVNEESGLEYKGKSLVAKIAMKNDVIKSEETQIDEQ